MANWGFSRTFHTYNGDRKVKVTENWGIQFTASSFHYNLWNTQCGKWGFSNTFHTSNFKHCSQYRQYTASTKIYVLRCCAIILFAVLKFSFCLSFPKFCPRQTADMSSCSSAPGPTTTMDGGYRDYLSRSISVIK